MVGGGEEGHFASGYLELNKISGVEVGICREGGCGGVILHQSI